MRRFSTCILGFILVVGPVLSARTFAAPGSAPSPAGFSVRTGDFTVTYRHRSGQIDITRAGKTASLALTEFPGGKSVDLLYGVRSIQHTGTRYTLTGTIRWTSFTIMIDMSQAVPGLIHVRVSVKPRRTAPLVRRLSPDVRVVHAKSSALKEYAPAPPVAGSSDFLSLASMGTSILYFADFTALGQYFDRTKSGVTQSIFTYPNAGDRGSLVGASQGTFGYVEPLDTLNVLPVGKTTVAVDSYLYLLPDVPRGETSMADTYLRMLSAIYDGVPKPQIPEADWKALADKEAANLADGTNIVTIGGKQFLRAYVSDTRQAPELITQAGVLAGIKAYEARFKITIPLDSMLEQNLPAFYDPEFHAVTNGLETAPDPSARGESWYFVNNMISLLQLAQMGSATAKKLLLDSTDAVIALAHTNTYEFPIDFRYSDWSGQGSGLQSDVAGGYSWLMLGLYDLTRDRRYLDEAKASIGHVAGKGFQLSYETHMTAYTAAAAERLYQMTKDQTYRGYALLALANLFHTTRLWDCTYGTCRTGAGYHTYFGLTPLPWSDYIAMLEQYEAWLALRDYLQYAQGEPTYVTGLVKGFVDNSPRTGQYALPPLLPSGAATSHPSEYPNVASNHLGWYIPLEDLREGEVTSGVIGQEIYGAGGPFWFAAEGP